MFESPRVVSLRYAHVHLQELSCVEVVVLNPHIEGSKFDSFKPGLHKLRPRNRALKVLLLPKGNSLHAKDGG